jgi:BASS family bile acid:Na+ symporter
MIAKVILAVSGILLVTTLVLIALGKVADAGLPMVGGLVGMALLGYVTEQHRRSSFTFWIFAFLAAAMYYPSLFTPWGFDSNVLVFPLLQLIMFGMGTKLSLADFETEIRSPRGLLVGTTLSFTVMPLLALLVANVFQFQPEIAVGLILIGACPGGAASNLMAFLARGNVALSVSVTTLTTLLTPIGTPLVMKLFADKLVEVSFLKIMLSSVNLTILPIVAGLICHSILYSKASWLQKDRYLSMLGLIFTLALLATAYLDFPKPVSVVKPGFLFGFGLLAIIAFAKVIVKRLHGPDNWMDRILPRASMLSILLIVTIVVALNRDKLLEVGLWLVAACAVLNLLGFVFGYWGSRLAGLSIRDSRTLSIEVAMKNGSLGMGLALEALGSANAALAPIVFGKWMNISGSIIANYWREKPTGEEAAI